MGVQHIELSDGRVVPRVRREDAEQGNFSGRWSEFWTCKCCNALNHETDAECQFCEWDT